MGDGWPDASPFRKPNAGSNAECLAGWRHGFQLCGSLGYSWSPPGLGSSYWQSGDLLSSLRITDWIEAVVQNGESDVDVLATFGPRDGR